MTAYRGNADYVHGTPPAAGVLVVNLGTPSAPTPGAVRRYLAEFLWDPRVVELPRPLWWLILHGLVLRLRPRRSARAYERIWTEEGPPLLAISQCQIRALQAELHERFAGPVQVALGMRYGRPSIVSSLEALRAANVRRLLVLPLYPQYAASTTASVFDEVTRVLRGWRWLPELRFITHYHHEPAYIEALAESMREAWAESERSERVLFSFHGLPRRQLLLGDPYYCECHNTARRLAEHIGLGEGEWQMAFQSRFGRAEWLQPYTDKTLESWARSGVRSVDVVCPGFSADCLETLEEIAEQNRDVFLNAGGERYRYIPALNDRPSHIRMLADLVERHSGGWPELATRSAVREDRGELERARELARARGAKQ